jgi:calcineurin-like phosphoesterase
VVNVQGRVFMPLIDCPFQAIDRSSRPSKQGSGHRVDVHADATSEKMAMAAYLDGRVALISERTPVPTADERILPKGTAYITDLGMCGAYDSSSGSRPRPRSPVPDGDATKFETAKANPWMCGIVADVDERTGRARASPASSSPKPT